MRTKLYYIAHEAAGSDTWRVEGYAQVFSTPESAVSWVCGIASSQWQERQAPSKILLQDSRGLWSVAAEFSPDRVRSAEGA